MKAKNRHGFGGGRNGGDDGGKNGAKDGPRVHKRVRGSKSAYVAKVKSQLGAGGEISGGAGGKSG